LVNTAVDSIQQYGESLLAEDGGHRRLVAEAVYAYRRFMGLPETDDDATVAAVLGDDVGGEISDTGGMLRTTSPLAPEVSEETADEPSSGQFDMAAELLEGFLLEAAEHLDEVGRLLPDLSDTPDKKDQVQQVRRSIHTLKGAAGVVGFPAVSQLTHRMEDVLDDLYDEKMMLTPPIKELLLATFDALDDFLRDKRAQGDFSASAQVLCRAYDQLVGTGETNSSADRSDEAVAPASTSAVEQSSTSAEYLGPSNAVPDRCDTVEITLPKEHRNPEGGEAPLSGTPHSGDVIRVPLERMDSLVRLVSELIISRSAYEQHLGRLIRQVEELGFSIDRLQRISTTIETQYEVSALLGNTRSSALTGAAAPDTRSGQDYTLLQEFDELEFDRYSEFHLISRELTETSADIGALGHEFRDILGDFDAYLTRQSRLTSEMQDKLMRLRMVPFGTLTTRLQRAVRVTAGQRGKDVVLTLQGEDVEFDKTMLEEMADPLLHLLRNAVDHGIEPAEFRRELGKDTQGQINLHVFREGTQIVITIQDDGAGIDPEHVRGVAVRKGLLSESKAAQMSYEQLYPLIFMPGFSTAKEVSEISGRGVGMDVVSTTVSQLKGRVALDSTLGRGTTFTIRLPLTLAISRVLIVKAATDLYAIPLLDVTQIVRIDPEQIEQMGESTIIKLGTKVYPLMSLDNLLGLPALTEGTLQHIPVVITQAGEQEVAIAVDQLLGGHEVVVKTLGTHLRRVHGVVGSTLMGDGSIVLILDTAELVTKTQRAGSWALHQTSEPRRAALGRASQVYDILVVDDSYSVRRVVANFVKQAGWNPILAKDGLEALEIIQNSTELPDLILLDVEMPQMDGYELTSTLRAHDTYRDIPIVMLTSRSGAKHRQKAFDIGANEYLVKPYRDETLLEVIQRLVAQSRGTTAA
jgi:chemosensory pili system protein ChpA (sensor histidine kinase/response regulator)